jgi:hypothetical protein
MTITELETLATDRYCARADAIAAVLANQKNVVRTGPYIRYTEAGTAALNHVHATLPTSEAVCGDILVRAISPKNLTVIRRSHIRFQYRVAGKLVSRTIAAAAKQEG